MIYFPETGWPATIFLFIGMMVRPNAIPGSIQNLAPDNVKTKPQNKIQFLVFDEIYILIRKKFAEIYFANVAGLNRYFFQFITQINLLLHGRFQKITLIDPVQEVFPGILFEFFSRRYALGLLRIHNDQRRFMAMLHQHADNFCLPAMEIHRVA